MVSPGPHLPSHAPIYVSVRALWLIHFRPIIGSFAHGVYGKVMNIFWMAHTNDYGYR